MTVGVLALQGDFADHADALARSGLDHRFVRTRTDLDGLTAMVLPGGESTTMLKLLDDEGLWSPLGDALRSGMPVLATCAGLILLATHVQLPEGRTGRPGAAVPAPTATAATTAPAGTAATQRSYGLLPVAVVRNGYGRQLHSGRFPLRSQVLPAGTSATFIRAPRITAVGPGCDVLAFRGDDPVLVRSGPILGACFHPELEPNHPVSDLFAAMVRGDRTAAAVRGIQEPFEPFPA
jgi:5'-phosphate synthase pdxT subunit